MGYGRIKSLEVTLFVDHLEFLLDLLCFRLAPLAPLVRSIIPPYLTYFGTTNRPIVLRYKLGQMYENTLSWQLFFLSSKDHSPPKELVYMHFRIII